MRIRAILTLVITAFSVAYAQKTQTFSDKQGRFTVVVPSGWRAVPINADCVQIGNGSAYLTVIVSGGDPGMAMDAIAHQFSGQWHGFTKLREGAVQLSGRSATFATYAGINPQGADANLKLIGMTDGSGTYLVMISATKAEFQRSKSALDQMEQSFHVNAAETAKPAAPSPAAPVAPAPSLAPAPVVVQPRAAHADYHRMKKVAIIDEHGFERPMQAMSLLIPADWPFQGSVQYNPNTACHPDIVHLTFRATVRMDDWRSRCFPITTGNGRAILKWCA